MKFSVIESRDRLRVRGLCKLQLIRLDWRGAIYGRFSTISGNCLRLDYYRPNSINFAHPWPADHVRECSLYH